MAQCDYCKKDMVDNKTETCIFSQVKIDGKVCQRNSEHFDINKRCHDCNIVNKKGNYHHYGCDMERCPKCKYQFAFCDCLKEEFLK